MKVHDILTRRQLLMAGSLGAAAWLVPGVYANELQVTPASTEGPFYPDRLPLDTDNDLVIVGNSTTPAVGEITHLSGRVLTRNGSPLNNLVVEIWQVDGNGAYLHTGSSNANRRDRNFQGFGRFTTNQRGEYRFRTVKPVSYPGRCPHIHFKVKRGDRTVLTSQIFITGDLSNARDGIYRGIGGIIDRELVSAQWQRIQDSRIVEYRANFDIVLGITPEERDDSKKGKK
ncbi:MAG: intradiol ring-cleavage dioxygenase [Planctomycetes bacterium]|nr:intradiol ring-cleavage dioxygenase [Planctomycetota bacterium]